VKRKLDCDVHWRLHSNSKPVGGSCAPRPPSPSIGTTRGNTQKPILSCDRFMGGSSKVSTQHLWKMPKHSLASWGTYQACKLKHAGG